MNPNLVNPNVAPVVDPSTVPFQEGWVKIRGIPPGTGKKELCAFFSVSPLIAAMGFWACSAAIVQACGHDA